MPRFRKKPVEIEAVQWHGESNCREVFEFLGLEHSEDEMDHSEIHIETLEGMMTARQGDWIIKGVHGERYPCKPDIFAKTYESAEEPSDSDRLAALEAAGVDNWEGYGHAMRVLHGEEDED